MRKYFILVVVVFVLVAGLLAQASIEEIFPTGKVTDRRAFLEGVLFAQHEIEMEALLASRNRGDNLAGLEGVGIVIVAVDPQAEKYGLTQQLLQTDTELRLRMHGIKVGKDV